jgi:hypothetical protein
VKVAVFRFGELGPGNPLKLSITVQIELQHSRISIVLAIAFAGQRDGRKKENREWN